LAVDRREQRFATTLASLAADPVELRVGTPTDAAWYALPEAVAGVEAWHLELAGRVGDRLAAASYLAAWLAEVPAVLIAVPVLLGAPLVEVELDDLHVRRHPEGWLDGLAVDPWSYRDPSAPFDAAAGLLHRVTAPVVAELARLPVGRAAVWGAVADAVAGRALHGARASGRDVEVTWGAVERLLDALQLQLGGRLVRPEPLLVPWAGGTVRDVTRGTCCRYHRTCAAPDPRGEGYCATCPLRAEDSRRERVAAHLDVTAARH
jgi:hypothetical protein